jgi:hypothetical protein
MARHATIDAGTYKLVRDGRGGQTFIAVDDPSDEGFILGGSIYWRRPDQHLAMVEVIESLCTQGRFRWVHTGPVMHADYR